MLTMNTGVTRPERAWMCVCINWQIALENNPWNAKHSWNGSVKTAWIVPDLSSWSLRDHSSFDWDFLTFPPTVYLLQHFRDAECPAHCTLQPSSPVSPPTDFQMYSYMNIIHIDVKYIHLFIVPKYSVLMTADVVVIAVRP